MQLAFLTLTLAVLCSLRAAHCVNTLSGRTFSCPADKKYFILKVILNFIPRFPLLLPQYCPLCRCCCSTLPVDLWPDVCFAFRKLPLLVTRALISLTHSLLKLTKSVFFSFFAFVGFYLSCKYCKWSLFFISNDIIHVTS